MNKSQCNKLTMGEHAMLCGGECATSVTSCYMMSVVHNWRRVSSHSNTAQPPSCTACYMICATLATVMTLLFTMVLLLLSLVAAVCTDVRRRKWSQVDVASVYSLAAFLIFMHSSAVKAWTTSVGILHLYIGCCRGLPWQTACASSSEH